MISDQKYSETEIKEVVNELRSAFYKHQKELLNLDFRCQQLVNLQHMVDKNEDKIIEALKKDVGKSRSEAIFTEISIVKSEISFHLENLKVQVKGIKPSVGFLNKFDGCKLNYDPLGTVLIICPWNYPIQLSLLPLIGAISAGNTVILKPSEVSPNTSLLLEYLFPKFLDQRFYKVINGGVQTTTLILKQRFDKIFYTGSTTVARIIMRAAAENLTPVALELGGKSPVIVDKNVTNTVNIARRIAFGRFMNSGQTCIAPDYVLATKEKCDELVEQIILIIKEQYGEDPQKSNDFGRIVNKHHFKRVKQLLENKGNGRIAYGGHFDESDLYVQPTLVVDCNPDNSQLLKEEIFGPILPFVVVKDNEEAVEYVNAREKPLALYLFSEDNSFIDYVRSYTSSGGLLINDTIVHALVPQLPFGGIGNSGMDSYHGRQSFLCFSHTKSTMHKSLCQGEKINSIRYPPYSEKKSYYMRQATEKQLPRGFANQQPIKYQKEKSKSDNLKLNENFNSISNL